MDNHLPQGSALEPIPNTRPIRNLFSRVGFSALGFLLMQQVTGFVIALIFWLLYGKSMYEHHFISAANAMQYLLEFPVCYLILHGAPKMRQQQKKLPFKYLCGAFPVAILLAQIGALIGLSCSSALSTLFGVNILDPLNETLNSISTAEAVLFTGILAPICEELIFRKFVLDRACAYGNGVAVFLSALLFGLVHCNIYQFFYAFLLGILLGYIYVKTGKIRYPILLHCVFNLSNGVLVEWLNSHIEVFNPALVLVNGYQAAYLAYVLFYWALLILGIVLVCVWFRKIKPDLSLYTKNLGKHFACAMVNPGVILTFLASIGLFLLTVATMVLA